MAIPPKTKLLGILAIYVMKTIAIIPSFDENPKVLQETINKTKKHVNQVLVIDDGSKEKVKVKNCKLLINEQNRGKGATLIKGFNYAIKNKFDIAITLDADGEHNPEEIPKFLEKINKYDFIIGQRTYYRTLERRTINSFANFWFALLIPKIKDMYCGFRAIKIDALNKMQFKGSGFELEPEMLLEAVKQKVSIGFQEIETKPIEKSNFKFKDYIKTNILYDEWIIKNHRFINMNPFKKLFLIPTAYIGKIISKILK